MGDAVEATSNDVQEYVNSEAVTPPNMGTGNPRWGMDWY
jgi:hypothetical protein